MCNRHSVYIFCLVFSLVFCLDKIPCSLEDHKCVTEAAQIKYHEFAAGIPSLGVEGSDPLHTDLIRQSLPNIYYQFTNAYLYGLANCNVTSFKIYPQQHYTNSEYACQRLTVESECDLYGHLGYLHVNGKGGCKIIMNDVNISVNSNLVYRVNDNGKIYVHLVRSLYGFDLKGGAEYEFRNMYNGDQELSNSASLYATKNWKLLYESFNLPILQKFSDMWVRNANAYFAHMSVDDVFSRLVATK